MSFTLFALLFIIVQHLLLQVAVAINCVKAKSDSRPNRGRAARKKKKYELSSSNDNEKRKRGKKNRHNVDSEVDESHLSEVIDIEEDEDEFAPPRKLKIAGKKKGKKKKLPDFHKGGYPPINSPATNGKGGKKLSKSVKPPLTNLCSFEEFASIPTPPKKSTKPAPYPLPRAGSSPMTPSAGLQFEDTGGYENCDDNAPDNLAKIARTC